MSVVVRAAQVPDAPLLAAFAERTFRDTYAAENTPGDLDRYVAEHFGVRRQEAELRDERMLTLLAEVDGQGVGYAQLARGPAPASVAGAAPMELVRFYVDRPWHGRGVAAPLMDSVAAAGRSAGAGTLWLGVWERNPRAIAFYRKCGFEESGSQIFVMGADHQHDLVLARPLG